MKKAYLLTFSGTIGSQEQIAALLNLMGNIVTTWRYDLPHAFYLISPYDAKTIAESLYDLLPIKSKPSARLIVTEISGNSWGWLTKESWDVIRSADANQVA
jgi:hypothetical protein